MALIFDLGVARDVRCPRRRCLGSGATYLRASRDDDTMTKAGQAIQQMLVSATEQETAYDDLETVVSVLPGVSRISDDQIMSLAPLTQGDISMYSISSLVDKLGGKRRAHHKKRGSCK